MKILLAVMTCEVSGYPVLTQTQKNTWGSIHHDQVETIYFQAGYKTGFIDGKLLVDVEEGTGWFYIKTMKAFKALLEKDWDFLVKTDNSAYVNKHALVKKIEALSPKTGVYAGQYYASVHPFLWGEGIVFSRDVVEYLVKEFESTDQLRSGVEDVHIGMILKDKFPWNTSFTIHEYYPTERMITNHIHRCKGESFQDTMKALIKIHNYYLEKQT